MEDVALEKGTPGDSKKLSPKETVICFVCKQEVERKNSSCIFHSKQKKVWICEKHLK